jgi:glucose-6-phosphate dehydrogenase assembly protein OpcA
VVLELIEHFPCRIFLIHFDETQKQPLYQASLLSPTGAKNLVCDFIQITLPPQSYPLLFSVIMAHRISDLPLIYLPAEHGDHLGAFTFKMAQLADKVICDSTDVLNLDGFIQNMQKLQASSIEVADLNWSRIESWRQMIALNLNHELLETLSHIQIVYNHKPSLPERLPFQALLLKGFIIYRMQNVLNRSVKVSLKPCCEESIWEGAILSCSFYDPQGTSQVFLRNLKKPQEAIIHFESPSECFMPQYIQFTKTQSGQSLIKEIRHGTICSDYPLILSQLKTYL